MLAMALFELKSTLAFILGCYIVCHVHSQICANYGDYDTTDGVDKVINIHEEVEYVNLNSNYTNVIVDLTAGQKDTIFNCTNPNGCNYNCTASAGCYQSVLYCDSPLGCNVRCDANLACSRMNIYAATDSANITIVCEQDSCEEMKVNISGMVSVNLYCIGNEACRNLEIRIGDMNNTIYTSTLSTLSSVSCYDYNSCRGLKMYGDESTTQLKMHAYSENVQLFNRIGYLDWYPNIECGLQDRYIKYRFNSTNNSIQQLVSSKYSPWPLPCDDVTVFCDAYNNSRILYYENSCSMQYDFMEQILDNIDSQMFGNYSCVYMNLMDVVRLSCIGTCLASPTVSPSPAPTDAPSTATEYPTTAPTDEPTEDPTANPTNDPTKNPTATIAPTTDPTNDLTNEPTDDPTANPTNDPVTDPTDDPTFLLAYSTTSSGICANYGDYDTTDGVDKVININEEVEYVNLNSNYTNVIVDKTAGQKDVIFNCTNPNGCNYNCTKHSAGCYQSVLYCDSPVGCNLRCDANFACNQMSVYAQAYPANLTIICKQDSCENMKIFVSGMSSAHLYCSGDEACSKLEIYLKDMENDISSSSVSCFDYNACPDLKIYADGPSTQLKMYDYSPGVIMSNHYGYSELKENIQCGLKNRYIQYQFNSNDTIQQLVDRESFACQDIIVSCGGYNDTNSSTYHACFMVYEYNDTVLEMFDKTSQNNTCVNIELADIITLDCIGTCIKSPTTTPTAAPTLSPALIISTTSKFDTTMENTIEDTVMDTSMDISSTLIAGSTATTQDSVIETMDTTMETMETTIDPQTAEANLLTFSRMATILVSILLCFQ